MHGAETTPNTVPFAILASASEQRSDVKERGPGTVGVCTTSEPLALKHPEEYGSRDRQKERE